MRWTRADFCIWRAASSTLPVVFSEDARPGALPGLRKVLVSFLRSPCPGQDRSRALAPQTPSRSCFRKHLRSNFRGLGTPTTWGCSGVRLGTFSEGRAD